MRRTLVRLALALACAAGPGGCGAGGDDTLDEAEWLVRTNRGVWASGALLSAAGPCPPAGRRPAEAGRPTDRTLGPGSLHVAHCPPGRTPAWW